MEKLSRLKEIDTVRVIGIYLVVLGHVIGHYGRNYIDMGYLMTIRKIIYFFHMPLFFFIAGLVHHYTLKNPSHQKNSYSRFILNKSRRLVYPYFTISIITIIIRFGLSASQNDIDLYTVYQQLVLIIVNPHAGSSPHLWFLHALFIVFLGFPLIKSIGEKNPIILWIIFIISFTSSFAFEYDLMNDLLGKAVFFIPGYLFFYKYERNIERLKRGGIFTIFLFSIIFIIVYVFKSHLIYILGALFLGFFGILSTIYIGYTIHNHLYNNKYVGNISKYLSEYTYDIYLIHYLTGVYTFGVIFFKIFHMGGNTNAVGYVVILPLIFILTSIIISKYILRKFTITKKLVLGQSK